MISIKKIFVDSDRWGFLFSVVIIIIYFFADFVSSENISIFLYVIFFGGAFVSYFFFSIYLEFLYKNKKIKKIDKEYTIASIEASFWGAQIGYSISAFLALYSWLNNPENAKAEPVFVGCMMTIASIIIGKDITKSLFLTKIEKDD